MSIFKRKKKIEKEQKLGPKKRKKEITEKVKQAEEKKKKSETLTLKVEDEKRANWKILREPHITEKATDLTEKNQYIFKVFPKANKIQIKKTIENFFKVNVLEVKIINVPRKKRRLGKIMGWRKGYKKAIIKVKQGQKIEILPR